MADIRIIALDLDGTLLTSRKTLAEEDRAALEAAAAAGVEIVPTTGRFYGMIPEAVRGLDFVHYAITINGAGVYDVRQQQTIASELIPLEEALQVMEYLDGVDCIYDCYQNNAGWMTAAQRDLAGVYAPDEHYYRMILDARTPVPDLKEFLRSRGEGIQKTQFFLRDRSLKEGYMAELSRLFPDLSVTTSVINNVEINAANANKGRALENLARHLGCTLENTMALGDGLNDLSMIRAAGLGVAMKNACPEVLEAADAVTDDNDSCGVGKAIRRLVLGQVAL